MQWVPPPRDAKRVIERKIFSVAHAPSETNRLVTSLSYSPCGHFLATSGEDDLLRVFATSPEAAFSPFPQGGGSDDDLQVASYFFDDIGTGRTEFASSSQHVLVTPRTGRASDILRFDLEKGVIDGAYHVMEKGSGAGGSGAAAASSGQDDEDEEFTALVHSPCAPVFCAAKSEGFLSFFNENVCQPIATLDRPASGDITCAFSPDGNRFAFADKWLLAVYDWRALARGPLWRVEPTQVDPDGHVCGIDFDPRNRDRMLCTSSNMVVSSIWCLPTRLPETIYQSRDEIHDELSVLNLKYISYKRRLTCTARFSPGGDMVAVGTAASAMLILDVHDQFSLAHKLHKCHRATVTGVAWNPRYEQLASSCQDVKLWSLKQKRSRGTGDADEDDDVLSAASGSDAIEV